MLGSRPVTGQGPIYAILGDPPVVPRGSRADDGFYEQKSCGFRALTTEVRLLYEG
jgi:hypothetical protein